MNVSKQIFPYNLSTAFSKYQYIYKQWFSKHDRLDIWQYFYDLPNFSIENRKYEKSTNTPVNTTDDVTIAMWNIYFCTLEETPQNELHTYITGLHDQTSRVYPLNKNDGFWLFRAVLRYNKPKIRFTGYRISP